MLLVVQIDGKTLKFHKILKTLDIMTHKIDLEYSTYQFWCVKHQKLVRERSKKINCKIENTIFNFTV